MVARILDGKKLSAEIRAELKEKIAKLPKTPELAVILAGNDAASAVYVRAKEKACTETGIIPRTYYLPEDVKKEQLLSLIDELNNNPAVNGILIQLPLPNHLNTAEILQHVSPKKDVDGFHPLNIGNHTIKQRDTFIPCTPKGIIRLLEETKENLKGLNAVVIGRSQIVGLPAARLLLEKDCTVTVTHSKTKNLPALCKQADILVAAIGKPEFITKDYINAGAIVIDVGINRTETGLKGDVCFKEAEEIASYITPVPGGVGPMTIAMLLENTYEAFLKQHGY